MLVECWHKATSETFSSSYASTSTLRLFFKVKVINKVFNLIFLRSDEVFSSTSLLSFVAARTNLIFPFASPKKNTRPKPRSEENLSPQLLDPNAFLIFHKCICDDRNFFIATARSGILLCFLVASSLSSLYFIALIKNIHNNKVSSPRRLPYGVSRAL
jgi:hypothetical protein